MRDRRRCGERIVAKHVNDEDGVAGADFVAVGEERFFHVCAIEESAVAALQVEDAAAFFAVVDGEVETGHKLVVGKSLVGFGIAADAERRARLESKLSPREGTRPNFEKNSHLGAPGMITKWRSILSPTSAISKYKRFRESDRTARLRAGSEYPNTACVAATARVVEFFQNVFSCWPADAN